MITSAKMPPSKPAQFYTIVKSVTADYKPGAAFYLSSDYGIAIDVKTIKAKYPQRVYC